MTDEVEFSGKSHVILIWDESGSMRHLTEEGRNVISEQLDAAKAAPGEVKFSLSFFGTHIPGNMRMVLNAVDPKAVKVVPAYIPTGSTPLHDAVGKTLTKLRTKVKKDDRALVVVFTDGMENSSREWDEKKVARLVGRLQDKGNWTFLFAAAGIDQWTAAQTSLNLGFMRGASISTPQTAVGMSSYSGVASTSTSTYLNSAAKTVDPSTLYGDQQAKVDEEAGKVDSST